MCGGLETKHLKDVGGGILAARTARNHCIYAYRLRITTKSLKRQ